MYWLYMRDYIGNSTWSSLGPGDDGPRIPTIGDYFTYRLDTREQGNSVLAAGEQGMWPPMLLYSQDSNHGTHWLNYCYWRQPYQQQVNNEWKFSCRH